VRNREFEHGTCNILPYLAAFRQHGEYHYRKVLIDSPFNTKKYKAKRYSWEVYHQGNKVGMFRNVKTVKEFIARKSN
jgi:hypothetical protein